MGALAVEESFPVIDFTDFETRAEETAKELFSAASRWGFLILKGHGIPQEDVDRMFNLVSVKAQPFQTHTNGRK
jgi:isopenicillin N synthase-like dioxygenase